MWRDQYIMSSVLQGSEISNNSNIYLNWLIVPSEEKNDCYTCQLFRDIAHSNWYSSLFELIYLISFFFFLFSYCIKLVISECNSVYCLNGGSCRDEPSGYKCDCRFGFYGKRCEGKFFLFYLFTPCHSVERDAPCNSKTVPCK